MVHLLLTIRSFASLSSPPEKTGGLFFVGRDELNSA
jgi:hypothetical protein